MTPRPPRGFTLIEVTVGAAVALIVIGIVTATFLSQQRSMQALDLSREASSAARDAMLSMQQTIGRAGYGIDPRYAFDFRSYGCPNWTAAAPCRDKINGPDEIVFVSRDPKKAQRASWRKNWEWWPESSRSSVSFSSRRVSAKKKCGCIWPPISKKLSFTPTRSRPTCPGRTPSRTRTPPT